MVTAKQKFLVENAFVRYYELMNKVQKVRYNETDWVVMENHGTVLKVSTDAGLVNWVSEKDVEWIVATDPEDGVTVTMGIDPDNPIQKCF